MQLDSVVLNKCLTVRICILFMFTLLQYVIISSQELYSGDPCTLLDGTQGICQLITTCKWLEKQIKSTQITRQQLSKLRCGFENDTQEITCCRTDVEEPPLKRKSQQACGLYRLERRPTLAYHIINGNFSALGEFPHMAALGYLSDDDFSKIEFKCGGSLISDRYILTAAHCSVSSRYQPIIARLGTINIFNSEINPVEYGNVLDANVETVILHPEYVSSRNYHDIALVYLTEKVAFNENLHPACLNTDISDDIPNTELLITGWGVVNTNTDAKSPFLLKTNLTVVRLEECNITLSSSVRRKLPIGLTNGHFCAHDPNGISGTCQGDSGGPLQIMDTITDTNLMPIIVGITSFGITCGTKLPSVYVRVAFYLDWIESIVWPD